MSDGIVEEAFGSLGQETVSYVATCDGGQPRVRPMMLINVDDVFYYATGTSDTKVAELMKNKKTEVCVLLGEGDDGGSLRMTGEMEFVYDEGVRAKIHGCVGFIQGMGGAPGPGVHAPRVQAMDASADAAGHHRGPESRHLAPFRLS